MRNGLTAWSAMATLLLANFCVAGSLDDATQDAAAARLIFQITKALANDMAASAETKSALGSSIEFAFLLLERSKSLAARTALAETAVLSIDAGGGESRSEAIIAKGKAILPALHKVATSDYARLCQGYRDVCMSEGAAIKYIDGLALAIKKSGR